MDLSTRHQLILEELNRFGSVTVNELSEKLDVSAVTIRKDLSTLENQEKLYRTHGKAILINPYTGNKHIDDKALLASEEKTNIGKVAANLIEAEDSILLASGTTVHALANEIKSDDHITVITSSLKVSCILANLANCDIIQLGGSVRSSSLSVVGNDALNTLDNFSCTKLFLGVDGVDLSYGLTTTNAMEAVLNRKMIEVAQKVIVLCDSTKFGRRGFSKICNIEEVDQIITDNNLPPLIEAELQDLGIEVTKV